MKTLHKFYEAGYIPKDVATSDTSFELQQDTWFVREETVGPADYGNSLLSRVANKDIQIKPITNFIQKNQTTQVANFVSSNNSKNKEKSMEVLNLLNGLVYGPEGKNWENLQVKKTVYVSLMPTKEILTWVDGTLVTTGFFTSTKTLQTNKSKILRNNWQKLKNLQRLDSSFTLTV